MVKLFYATYISVDLAHHEIFHAKVGKGGIKYVSTSEHGIAPILFSMRRSGEGQGVRTPSLINHKKIGFLSNTGPDPPGKFTKLRS